MPTVDVTSHRDGHGKLYMPSYPWGIHLHGPFPASNGGPVGSDSRKTKQAALELAQTWCDKAGNSAEVFRRKDGVVVARYWRDSEGMQRMEY